MDHKFNFTLLFWTTIVSFLFEVFIFESLLIWDGFNFNIIKTTHWFLVLSNWDMFYLKKK